jgi:ABC-type multidrug transport system fused ATPase/permease subunit
MKRACFRAFFQKNRLLFAVALVLSGLPGLAGVVFSWLQAQALDAAAAGDLPWLGRTFCLGIFAVAASFCLTAAAFRTKTRFLQRAVRDYKDFAFDQLARKRIGTFSDQRTGTYLSMLTNDTPAIEDQYLHSIFVMAMEVVLFAGSLAAVLRSSWKQGLLMLALCGLTMVVSMSQARGVSNAARALSDENERFTGTVKDMLGGFAVIKAFQAEKAALGQFRKANAPLEERRFRWRWADCRVYLLGSELCDPLVTGSVIFYGAWQAARGEMTVGTVVYLVNLMTCLMAPVQVLPRLWAQHRAARGLVEKLATSLEETPEPQGLPAPSKLQDAIVLDHVTFGYEPDTLVLRDLSLRLEQGKAYAIVGASGSGKTTLLNLLMGACEGYGGSITLDGQELRETDRDSLYDLLSLVRQDVFIFDSTLRDNLTMFQNFPEPQLQNALEQAGLMELVRERGLDCPCGENGTALSGGQRQRVAIARCLLRQTPVLLMDEATASLDNRTAFAVTDAILRLDGLTRVAVTHRLDAALLRRFDQIVVLRDGAVAEQGSFDRLMAEKGYFYSLYNVTN